MSRTLSAQTKLDLVKTNDVLINTVIKLTIDSVDYWYGKWTDDPAKTGGGTLDVQGKILEMSPIKFSLSSETTATIGRVSVAISDSDNELRALLESEQLYQTPAVIYMYTSPVQADFIELFNGVLFTPLGLSEPGRTVTVEVMPKINSVALPWTPTEESDDTALDSVKDNYWGKPWPTAFGKVVDAPCQLTDTPNVMFLRTSIDESASINVHTEPRPDPRHANEFTNATTAQDYFIGREQARCVFGTGSNVNRLTLTTRNKSIVTGSLLNRPTVGQDPDAARKDVLYVSASARFVGLWVVIGTEQLYCIAQVGTKCFFISVWAGTYGSGKTYVAKRYHNGSAIRWQHQAGTPVTRPRGSNGEKIKYLISDAATASIKRIRAWRSIPVLGGPQAGESVRELVDVPDSYYTVNLANTIYRHTLPGITNRDPTSVTFDPGLRYRMQGWEDETVYASVLSNADATYRRNTASHLKYIFETYTDFTVDTTSYGLCRTAVSAFPCDYSLKQPKDAVAYAKEIAFQARIGLLMLGSTVKMKYLSVGEPSVANADGEWDVDDDNTTDREVIIGATETEDLKTVLTGVYRVSYAYGEPELIVRRTNDDIYGESFRTIDFYIYQHRKLVAKSLTWWANRMGRSWKLVRFTMKLPGLSFEPLDFINLDVDFAQVLGFDGATSVRVMVIEQSIDTDTGLVELLCWTPVEDGTSSKSTYGWASVSDPSSSVTADPFDGYASSVADDIEAVAVPADGS